MAARPRLVVLIVREAGLCSALAARLSRRFDLLTAARWESVADRRLIRPPAVLVIDEQSVGDWPDGWADPIADEHGFARIVVLTADIPRPATRARLMQINRNAEIDDYSLLFADLAGSDRGAPRREV